MSRISKGYYILGVEANCRQMRLQSLILTKAKSADRLAAKCSQKQIDFGERSEGH